MAEVLNCVHSQLCLTLPEHVLPLCLSFPICKMGLIPPTSLGVMRLHIDERLRFYSFVNAQSPDIGIARLAQIPAIWPSILADSAQHQTVQREV